MKLAVCGCSWSSVDQEHKGIEFGSLISSHLNAEYINLAKPGCSNFGIALQVDYALKHYDPDVFIINAKRNHVKQRIWIWMEEGKAQINR